TSPCISQLTLQAHKLPLTTLARKSERRFESGPRSTSPSDLRRLEVDTSRQLPNAGVVRLSEEPVRERCLGSRSRRSEIRRPKARVRSAPFRRIHHVEELAAYLEARSLPNREPLEHGDVHQRLQRNPKI